MDGSRGLHSSGESLGRRVRLNTVVIPQVRALGFVAVLVLCGLNHALISASVSDRALVVFILATATYVVGSWLTLAFFYTRLQKIDLAQIYLHLDIVFFTLAVYVTGGDHSWLLVILVLRAADQAANGFTTVLRFAHLSTAAYIALLIYLHYGEQRQLNWSVEIVKVIGLYFANLYVSVSALVLDKMRRQMRNARDLILQLQKKARELEQERKKASALAAEKEAMASSLSSRLRAPLEQIALQAGPGAGGEGIEKIAAATAQALAALSDLTHSAGTAQRTFHPAGLIEPKLASLRIPLRASSELPAMVCGDAVAVAHALGAALSEASPPVDEVEIRLQKSDGRSAVVCYVLHGAESLPDGARHKVRESGGKFRAANDPGRGLQLVWSFSLPLPEGAGNRVPPKVSGPLRILVAEDNPVNQRVMRKLLEKRGYVVSIASNGKEAVDAAAAEPFDCILMDIMMPVMDGFAATRIIRLAEAPRNAHVPIIAVTALGEDHVSYASAGLDGWLPKPFQPDDLYRAIELLA